MPESLGFMEMFKTDNVLQLNVPDRGRNHDSSRSLAAPVGLGGKGELIDLDLHEDAHGPHGLIAGTTGSGKSEFIITWVLSMCVNYSPDEAAFVLIDYKGGGLAGAFDNERYRLPHLAGTITNLDGAAVARSMVSIQSELKRRQALFNEACDITGEATMDIGKYISYWRQGVLKDPCPHLFVVADEFAELKQQEPAFMDELVSAARIGRSLGLHLVLATQKPTGVVSDQISSNARFRVSLKVADASDSREMIRRPDAEKGLDFLSDFIKYDQDPNRPKGIRDPKKLFESIRDQIKKELKDGFEEKLKESIKNELKDEFKDFLPYDTYFRERKGQHAKDKGRKISNDFKEIIDDWKNGRENEKIRHAKSDGDHSALGKPKGLFETKGEISAVGKSAKMLSKGLGVVGKAIDVYTVGSKGVAAFNGTKGSLGDKLGAGLKASGKEGVKVGVSTAVTAVVTGALTVIVPGGPFIAAGVCLVGGLAGGYLGDKAGGKASDFVSHHLFGDK